jgi:DNA invertase Pin-like site-specific DNA recombinase
MQINIAYIRISDPHKQDPATQRQRISDYAIANNIIITRWVESDLSGSKTTKSARGITEMLGVLKEGDNLIISDIDRLGRDSISDIIETVTRLINNGITLHLAYGNQQICPADKNDLAKIFITIGDAYAAVRFAKERSQKAKAAAERRLTAGLLNGRRPGAIVVSKLDQHEKTIVLMRSEGASEYAISEALAVDRLTLRRWQKRRSELIDKAKEISIWQPGMTISDIKERLKKQR